MPGPDPAAHQVLVYAGPGVSALSLSHTLFTLSLLLVPHYTVQPVQPAVLATEPWEPSCALLVIPGGRDLPYVDELSVKAKVTRRIAEYVAQGGRYLGICAGAYFGATDVQFDLGGPKEVIGKRDLGFFPGTCAGPTYKGFDYGSERGAKAVSLIAGDRCLDLVYYNGGGHFLLPTPLPTNIEVLAKYAEPPSPEADIAVVQVTRGKGKVLLSGMHFEYPLEDPPARHAIAKLDSKPENEEVKEADTARIQWATDLLVGLGLNVPSRPDSAVIHEEEEHLLNHPTHPSPIFLLSHPNLPQLAATALAAPKIQAKITAGEGGWMTLPEANDKFEIGAVNVVGSTTGAVADYLAQRRRTEPVFPPAVEDLSLASKEPDATPAPPQAPDLHSLTKTLLTPARTLPYSPAWTPLFNFETYWTELDAARKAAGRRTGVMRADELSKGKQGERPTLGDLVLYGETVTSTQTMLDRNTLLLNGLPTPSVFLASFQLSGRGRGGNLWLSPAGCLQFSVLATLPQKMANKLVFVQYLMALAVAEAVDEDGRLGVRIKWPNDIYAQVEGVGGTEVGGGKKGLAKIAGILVNTNFMNGQWRVVIGTGINTLNALPTTALSQLHSLLAGRSDSSATLPPIPTMEGTFARIMHAFEMKWGTFIEAGGFEPFMDEYHSRWLHGGQEVTLTTCEPHQRLRIVGITPDCGFLRGVPIGDSGPTGLTQLYDRGQDSYDDRSAPTWTRSGGQQYVDLQPDGNSFDLMSGMIKRKM